MRRIRSTRFVGLTVLAISLSAVAAVVIPNLQHFRDVSGAVATFNTAGNGNLDEKNAFFQNQGTNGRSCASCHQPAQAFSITPEAVQEVYHRTHGQDPIFAAVDGANCPTGRQNDEDAHSLLLQNGLIRVAITLHANPQFTIEAVHDPYKCAISYDPTTGSPIVSVYRRRATTTCGSTLPIRHSQPLPATIRVPIRRRPHWERSSISNSVFPPHKSTMTTPDRCMLTEQPEDRSYCRHSLTTRAPTTRLVAIPRVCRSIPAHLRSTPRGTRTRAMTGTMTPTRTRTEKTSQPGK